MLTIHQLIYINQTLRIEFGIMAHRLKYAYQQNDFVRRS
jgi:hypothetical protein